jgi:hypothetical protein
MSPTSKSPPLLFFSYSLLLFFSSSVLLFFCSCVRLLFFSKFEKTVGFGFGFSGFVFKLSRSLNEKKDGRGIDRQIEKQNYERHEVL